MILGRYEESKRPASDKIKRTVLQQQQWNANQSRANRRSYLNETIQFIIVTDEGRCIQPVVNAARKFLSFAHIFCELIWCEKISKTSLLPCSIVAVNSLF